MYNSLALKLLDVYKYVNKSQLANNFISIKGDSVVHSLPLLHV